MALYAHNPSNDLGPYCCGKEQKGSKEPTADSIRDFPHSYPDVFHPQSPYPLYHLNPVFTPGSLVSAKGKVIEWTDLFGKSVALYFADNSIYRCKSFLPVLWNVYRTFNESGDSQKVEIIFVTMDKTMNEYEEHRARQPWLALPFDHPLIETFKRHYRVMHTRETVKYGCGPRITPPALLVIKRTGELLQRLEISEEPKLWRKWDVVSQTL